MEFLFLSLLELIFMTIGITYLFVGIKLCARRSIAVKTRVHFIYLALPSLSIVFIFSLCSIVYKVDSSLFYTMLIALIFCVFIFFTNTFKYGLQIFNITKDVLYNCILTVFQQLEIEYDIKHEKRYSKIIFRNINASMTIHFLKSGCSLRFIKPKNIPSLNTLIKELQTSLRGREFNKISFLGIFSIIAGVSFFILGSLFLYTFIKFIIL